MNTTTIHGRHRQSAWLGFRPVGVLLALLALLVLLTACSGQTAELTPTEEPAPAATTEPEPVEPIVEETTEPEPAPEPEYGGFGKNEGYVWDDGLSVTLTGLEEFTPSEWAAFDESPYYVRFTVTVVNDGAEPYDPAMFIDTLQSADTEGSSIFDNEQGLSGSPMTSVLPGRSVSWDVAYGVTDLSDLVVEITPGWDYDAAIFVGGL